MLLHLSALLITQVTASQYGPPEVTFLSFSYSTTNGYSLYLSTGQHGVTSQTRVTFSVTMKTSNLTFTMKLTNDIASCPSKTFEKFEKFKYTSDKKQTLPHSSILSWIPISSKYSLLKDMPILQIEVKSNSPFYENSTLVTKIIRRRKKKLVPQG
jgi:hypothetical protein